MTKIKTTRQIEIQNTISVVCDLCGCKADQRPKGPTGVFENWNGSPPFDDSAVGESSYSIWEPVEIEYEQGYRYPEGGQVERLQIDLCPRCFRNKFLRWFNEQGGTIPAIQESDY